MVFAPLTGDLTAISVDGKQLPVVWATESGRRVGMVTVDLKPGASATLTAVMSVTAPARGASALQPVLDLTPGVTPWTTSAEQIAAC